MDVERFRVVFGIKIKAARRAKGINQRELAKRLDIAQSSVSHLEAGARDTTLSLVARICHVLDISMDDIIAESIAEVQKETE